MACEWTIYRHFIRLHLSSTNPSLSSLGVKSLLHFIMHAAVMELVDLVDSKSSAFGRVGSNPTCGTTISLIHDIPLNKTK